MPDSAEKIRYPWPDAPGPGEAVAVADGIVWLRLPLPMALDHVNVYALRDDDGWTLVDTGMATGRTRAIWSEILGTALGDAPVARVLVTHHHPDHIGLAGWFQERGAELLTPRTGWLMARMLCLDEQPRPDAATLAFWRGAGMPADMLAERAEARPFNFADCVAPLPLGYTRLVEGQGLRLAGRDWTVRMGDGHAPEHATLWSDEIVLGGDQLLPGISPNLGVYASEPDADPVSDWLASCARFAALADPRHLVLPGHKVPYTGLPERLAQLSDNHRGALRRLRDHLAVPRTAAECFAPLFKREITPATFGLALVEAVAHLNHLRARGEIRRNSRPDGAWLWSRA